MALRHALPGCLFLLVVTAGCREKSTAATADPATDKGAPRPTTSADPVKVVYVDQTVVTTNKVEIPRLGHDPVVLELPVVKGSLGAAVDEKINAMLTPEKILGESIDDVRDEAKRVKSPADLASGVQSARYSVLYNRHGILEIETITEFMGAYPSSNRFHVLIDVVRGDFIGEWAFLPARVPALVKRLDAMLQAEAKASDAAKDPYFADLLKEARFEAKDLWDFSVSDDGLTFNYDYGFPHVALALQPKGRFFLPWSDVWPDVAPGGPLARVRPVP